MPKNMDFRDTYSTPEHANVRYPSVARGAINGWAYVFSKDEEYVFGLSQHHVVEVRFGDQWIRYTGDLPDADDETGPEPPPYTHQEDEDPNY